ncbi:MAG TPA: HAD hydrolase family protein [Thermoleophilia bacterium]|nr:HAD hydrolase family protein [Thermoleophilia bacterium]
MDVDGVLTDGTFFWGADGSEFKRFCFSDVTALGLARRAGLPVALISGESSESGMSLVQRYADKLRVDHVYKGCHDKATALREFAAATGRPLEVTCYIGDDVIDLPAMSIAGLSVAPSDAHPAVLAAAAHVTQAGGGHGVVREVVDLILGASTAAR